jgi:hypothetical protein
VELVEVVMELVMVVMEVHAGTVNTGGGGGGGGQTGSATGTAGGKGVVILSMPLANFQVQQLVLQQNQMMEQLKF